MKITKQAKREAKQLFRSCVAGGLLDEGQVRLAVQRLVEAKPRGYLAVVSHFARLVKLDLDRRRATVESAVALPQDLQTRVQTGLTQTYGPGLNFSFAQTPALIGGLRVKVGSDVYDGSIQARLAALEAGF